MKDVRALKGKIMDKGRGKKEKLDLAFFSLFRENNLQKKKKKKNHKLFTN